ncbi:universal stress protein [Sulfuritalea hydrogenivorans]|jgi:nucleotide-binding universal stress UspA family protein|uniref:UspA domain-containing protein n=1 Tax=Sulfuritalea hydrogenivorans sk43H TaxID=1223802 RepID=W0SJ26_9PROT|nr:universal stress protein [Sulfuritalea hydrogenivorans]MDK9714297.1 universal stress protein [Sulfuritalea sp.]BAO30681.1 UspA domain-containing protein [Sulfuritalea hydrogenivorans sk43H]
MTQKWLVPIDGSDIALHSVAWIARHAADWREPPQILLINVQASLPGDIGRFIDAETLREFHLEAGMAALAPARDQLKAAGFTAELHVMVGEAAATITAFADSHGCSQILIGTRGHSGLAGTLLGSVAMKVVHLSNVPVLLVR